jgi:type IV pilus assembly protein PilA
MLARIHKAQDDEGFTLIELLVVIIIIGILAAIAIPVFLNQRQKGYDAQAKSDARNLATLEETYLTDHNVYVAEATQASATTDLNYKPSANVTGAVIAIDASATPGTVGYCIATLSSSGKSFWYDNQTGGLSSTLPGVTNAVTCPAAG